MTFKVGDRVHYVVYSNDYGPTPKGTVYRDVAGTVVQIGCAGSGRVQWDDVDYTNGRHTATWYEKRDLAPVED